MKQPDYYVQKAEGGEAERKARPDDDLMRLLFGLFLSVFVMKKRA